MIFIFRKLTSVEVIVPLAQALFSLFILYSLLFVTYAGDRGNDTLGTPLLHSDRVEEMWSTQKRHIKCIQDVPDCPLYTEVDQVRGGNGIDLPIYRCARGSTSLESFHLHLQRFVPGKMTLNTKPYNHNNYVTMCIFITYYFVL